MLGDDIQTNRSLRKSIYAESEFGDFFKGMRLSLVNHILIIYFKSILRYTTKIESMSKAEVKSPVSANSDPDFEVEEVEKLLDEVESSFLTGFKPYNPKKILVSSEEARSCPCSKKTDTNWEEVEELLREFRFEDTNPFSKSKNKSWARPDVTRTRAESKEDKYCGKKTDEKCYRVYLAGSYEVMGCSIPGSEKYKRSYSRSVSAWLL